MTCKVGNQRAGKVKVTCTVKQASTAHLLKARLTHAGRTVARRTAHGGPLHLRFTGTPGIYTLHTTERVNGKLRRGSLHFRIR